MMTRMIAGTVGVAITLGLTSALGMAPSFQLGLGATLQ